MRQIRSGGMSSDNTACLYKDLRKQNETASFLLLYESPISLFDVHFTRLCAFNEW